MSRLERTLIALTVASILWLGLPLSGPTAERKTDLSVIYNPPRLSVEARGVGLERLLEEIGAKVGFGVVDYAVSDAVVSFSIQDATVEEVLRQLLRAENHAIVYRGQEAGSQGAAVDKILLLSPPTYVAAAPRLETSQGAERRHEGVILSRAVPSGPVPSPQVDLSRAPQRTWGETYEGSNKDATDFKVDEILKVHALTQTQTLTGMSAPASMPSTPSTPNVNETLAITTRLAQQNLGALISGLSTATNSLLQSLANKGR